MFCLRFQVVLDLDLIKVDQQLPEHLYLHDADGQLREVANLYQRVVGRLQWLRQEEAGRVLFRVRNDQEANAAGDQYKGKQVEEQNGALLVPVLLVQKLIRVVDGEHPEQGVQAHVCHENCSEAF